MPKYNKPESLNTIWGINALAGDNVKPSDSKIQTGWIQEKPPFQTENWINEKHDQWAAYSNQLGIPEWDSTTEYQAGKSYVQGSNNRVYKCIQTHINKNPATAGNEAFWGVFDGDVPSGTFGSVSNSSFIIQNLDGNIKRNFLLRTGSVNMSSSTQTISFPISFPNVCLGVIVTSVESVGDPAEYVQVVSFNSTSFSCVGYNIPVNANNPTSDTQNFTYLAIGY